MKEPRISFLLDEEELMLMHSVLYLEPFLVDGVERARKLKSGKYKLRFSVYDLMGALDALSFAAGYAPYREKAKLRCLHDKIKGYLLLSSDFCKIMEERSRREKSGLRVS
ncbi:MAG: hypothetical protein ACE5GG_05415 [Candidatus Omnitrophota bacterium]